MSNNAMTEAEAMARFGQDLDDISARGRAPDSAEQVVAIIAEIERECATLRRKRLRKPDARAINR